MKRRIIAVLCLLVVLAGTLAVSATAEQENDRYQVGYSKKDMNPWTDPENPSVNSLVDIPLAGYANSMERLATAMMDDNGDGVTDASDGLHTTCTSVTDAYGKTVMYFTIDTIGAEGTLVNDLRKALVKELGDSVISTSDIMVNASHSHEGPDYSCLRSADSGSAWRNYYNHALAQMVAAGVEAYNNRTEAVMTKGEVDASESSGYQLNAVRHYNVVEESKTLALPNIPWKLDKQFIGGDNFGGPDKTIVESNTFRRRVESVSEVNDTMYLTRFTPVNGDAPIVWATWRAHASLNGGSASTVISSDYINSFRYQMEKHGYRVAFFQGTSGNVNPRHAGKVLWENANVSDAVKNPIDSNKYGYLLSRVALDGLDNHMTDELEPGKIRTVQSIMPLTAQTDSEGLQAAAEQYFADVEEGRSVKFPYKYTHTDGKLYILNSKYHANNVRSRNSNTASGTINAELNVIALGNSVLYLTAPFELFDRYSLEASLGNTSDNDWLDLNDDSTYGTPVVLGYSNDAKSYLPNAFAYDYNEGSTLYGVGSYEANIARVARGEGERVIQEFAAMIQLRDQEVVIRTCEACAEKVEWKELTARQAGAQYLGSGHYYMTEDFPIEASTQKILEKGDKLCLDLNGHSITTKGRTFNVVNGSTLNLVDSAGGGQVTSYSGNNNVGGGVVSCAGTFKLYGGTLQFIRTEEGIKPGYDTAMGGVVSCTNKFYMYGGTLIGGQMGKAGTDANGKPLISNSNGCGGTVRVASNAYFYLYGGTVKSGKAAESGEGDCVYLHSTSSKMYLSGDACVDNIYINSLSSSSIYIKDTYTGTANVEFDPGITLVENLDFGNTTGKPDITGATLTCVNDSRFYIIKDGTNIRLSYNNPNSVAVIRDGDKVLNFDTVQGAVDAYSAGYIMLLADTDQPVNVDKDVYLDMNGFDITGEFSINDGCVVYGFDNMTDDFTVLDTKGYGVLSKVSCKGTGKVTGVPMEWELAEDGYLMADEDGSLSFHRVKMQIYAMDLRAKDAGIYYRSHIMGDELVAQCTAKYGVALSVVAEPNEKNLSDCELSAFEDMQKGTSIDNANVMGTLLSGILKKTNTNDENIRNGSMSIYGRPYVLSGNGQYVFGQVVERTLQQQLEDVDKIWDTLNCNQTTSVLEMYNDYSTVMEAWQLPNIKKAAQHYSDNVIKILFVGNEHSMDSVQLLGDVFKAENPGQSVVIGVLSAKGASMEDHGFNARKDLAAYDYYEYTDSWEMTEEVSLSNALSRAQWDMIVLQQVGYKAGLGGEYQNAHFTHIINAAKRLESAPVIAWNMVWSDPDDEMYPSVSIASDWDYSHHTWYVGADGKYDQGIMYEKIAQCTQDRILTNCEIGCIVPTGTAIQYAQDVLSREETAVYRNSTNLSEYGQLIAAYVWYAKLMNLNALENVKVDVEPDVKNDIIACVNWTLSNPYQMPTE